MPNFINYIKEEHKLIVNPQREKDIGDYALELCAFDGYSNPSCVKFTLSVEDPDRVKL
jgi:hypothetical protein